MKEQFPNVPLTAAQLEELRRREENYKQNPSAAMTWEQVKTRILRERNDFSEGERRAFAR